MYNDVRCIPYVQQYTWSNMVLSQRWKTSCHFSRPFTRCPKYEIQKNNTKMFLYLNHIMCLCANGVALTLLAVLVCIHLCTVAVVERSEGELDVGAKRNAPPTSLICISNFMQLLLLQLGPCRDFSLTPHFYGFSQRLGRITPVTI